MKRFEMYRAADESGVSGTGKVIEGVVFSGGKTVVQWCVEGKPNSTAVYDTFEDFKYIHVDSHPTNGTTFKWLEAEPIQGCCEKCWHYSPALKGMMCLFHDCPCHRTPSEAGKPAPEEKCPTHFNEQCCDGINHTPLENRPCFGGCGFTEPYGFVPEADCPVHDSPSTPARIEKLPPIGPDSTVGWSEEAKDIYLKVNEIIRHLNGDRP